MRGSREAVAKVKKLSRKTINLLRKIEQHILAEPRRLNMNRWGTVYDLSTFAKAKKVSGEGKNMYIPGLQGDKAANMPPCGTVGCIAGWALFLTRPKTVGVLATKAAASTIDAELNGQPCVSVGQQQLNATIDDAQELLGLDQDQANRLCYFSIMHAAEHWPYQFEEAYENAKTPRARAKVTVKRIEHFIATNGAE